MINLSITKEQLSDLLNLHHQVFYPLKHFVNYKQFKSILFSKKIDDKFNGILFFSPSAVQSYCHHNKIENETLFTIGKTTASEAETHSKKIITSKSNSIEQVIDNAIKHFTYDKK